MTALACRIHFHSDKRVKWRRFLPPETFPPGTVGRSPETRLGAPKAITAMARKLACLFYRLIKHGHQYVDQGTEYYEARYREQQIRSLAKRAQKLGLQLVIPKTA